jgi:hypothetical protein
MKHIKRSWRSRTFQFALAFGIENNEFEAVGIDFQWTDVPEGTGKCVRCFAMAKLILQSFCRLN